MSRLRCECCVGDTPHAGGAVHKKPRSRCTRTATVRLRKAADKTIGGKTIKAGPWADYCEPCAAAIEAYQGDIVEREKRCVECQRSEEDGASFGGYEDGAGQNIPSDLCDACWEAAAEADAEDSAKLAEARRLVAAAPHRFMTDKAEPSRVKHGEEDVAHCALCGQAEDRPIHRTAAKPEPKPEKLGRCECCVGDTPHAGAQIHKRPRRRCTRTATVQLRKAADRTIGGKAIPAGPWCSYCAPCAEAIEAYQGDIVERRKEAVAS